jgi:translation initiation factor IF-1
MDNEEFQRLVLQELTGIKDKVAGVETRMENIETRMDHMETRQDEIYQVVKAIEHSNQVGRAEMDSQNVRLARVEGKLKRAGEVLSDDIEAAGI